MRNEFKISEHGYITKWLVAEPQILPFSVANTIDDQLLFERHMRECVADQTVWELDEVNCQWEKTTHYLQNQKNWFVDFSEFYHLTRACLKTQVICTILTKS